MSREKILIPLEPDSKDLKAVYHALALAERIKAKVYIVFFRHNRTVKTDRSLIEEACLEVINSACEDGLTVSYHISMKGYEDELLNIIETEHIDLIVIGHGQTRLERIIKRIMPQIACQVVQVKEKNDVNFLQ